MATISLCMIVKNEAALLARCLDSLRDIPDEIIIVDTGSTDQTKKIAGKYTEKLFDFPWGDDFSAARNFSLGKATMEYIYTADADEVIDEQNLRRFRELKQALLEDVEIVEMAYANQLSFNTAANFDVEYRPKLFRRLRAFRFMDPVHETLRTDPIVFRSDVVITHCPASLHSGRDLQVFARHARNGVRFSARLETMYARELLLSATESELLSAQPYFESVLREKEAAPEALRRAACVLAFIAAKKKDAALMLRAAAPELMQLPPSEICCALGDFYLAVGDADLAAEWYTAAQQKTRPELIAVAAGPLPLKGLAQCHALRGDTENSARFCGMAESWRPEDLFA